MGMDFSCLENVVMIAASLDRAYNFLLTDGTLRLMTPYNEYSKAVERHLPKWGGISAIADADWVFMALKQDGTVTSDSAIAYFADWTDVVEIAGGYGVKADGSVPTEKEFTQRLTEEQLDEIRAWKVMVDPESLPAKTTETP